MNKFKRINVKLLILLLLSLVMSVCIGLVFLRPNNTAVYAATESSALTFTSTSDTECAVRLSDKTATKVTIPATAEINGKEYTVTSIVANGFASATNLEKVRLPNTIKSIGQSAFANCKSLSSITLTAVESIGANAFALTNMDYIIIPETVTTVAGTILRNTSTKVYVRAELPEGETLPAGNWASNWNTNNSNQDVEYGSTFEPEIKYIHSSDVLASSGISLLVSTPEGEGYIVDGEQEFTDQDYNEVIIPATYNGQPVIGISNSAFFYNSISRITIEYAEEAINLETSAFEYCQSTTVIINRSITLEDENDGISTNVFANSIIETIILPDTIEIIGATMFDNCEALTDIHFITPNGLTMDEIESLLNRSTSEVYLPDSVKYIGDGAFSCTYLIKQINIPEVAYVGKHILDGWSSDNDQKVYMDFAEIKLQELPWDNAWNEGCEAEIEFSSILEYKISYNNVTEEEHDNPKAYTRKDKIDLNDAQRKGYLFKGWYKNSDFTGDIITTIPVGTTGDIELFANFIAIQYTIVYDPNKPDIASNEVDGFTKNSTHKYDEIDYLNNNGYKLIGWKFVDWLNEETGTHYADADLVKNLAETNDATVTLKAQWKPIEYTLVYNSNRPGTTAATPTGVMNSEKLVYDKYYNLANVQYTLPGFSFVRWETEQGEKYGNGAPVKNLTTVDGATVTLYAQWQEGKFSVEYKPNKPDQADAVSANVTGTMSNSEFTFDSGVVLTENAFELKGWEFTGWNTESDGSGAAYGNEAFIGKQSSNITLFAQWQISVYDIIYEANDGVNPESNPTTYTILDEITFADPELRGYDGQWNIQSIQKGSTGTQNVYASYTLRKYEIKYNLNGGTPASDSPETYDIENIVEFKTPTKQCYTFLGWKYNGEYIKNTDGLAEHITLDAVWSEGGTLYVSDTEVKVNDDVVKLYMPNSAFNTYCHIMVGPDVRDITFVSTANLTFSMYIDIQERDYDINVTIQNFSIQAPNDCSAITMQSEYTLNLYTLGTCTISGGKGSDGSYGSGQLSIGKSGAVGIKCHKLIIHSSNLTICGGNGGNGADGLKGNPNGLSGKRGGNGNYAVYVTDCLEIKANNVTLKGGNGGIGGNGGSGVFDGTTQGHGGAGGAGGIGSVAVYGVILYDNYTDININAGSNGADGREGFVEAHLV